MTPRASQLPAYSEPYPSLHIRFQEEMKTGGSRCLPALRLHWVEPLWSRSLTLFLSTFLLLFVQLPCKRIYILLRGEEEEGQAGEVQRVQGVHRADYV